MRLLKFLFALCLLLFAFYFFAGTAYGQASSCSDTTDPEFHSLRPYPAEPCNPKKENLSYICGNDMVLTDTITVSYTQGDCTGWGGTSGVLNCSFDIERGFTVDVDPAQSELPIMGNTEDVINSTKTSDDLNDAQKINEYVSWYLNGVINRAEYAFLKWNDPIDIAKIINFSGPIRKLLPQRIQDNAAVTVVAGIAKAAATREKQVTDAGIVRHNQIVGCTWGLNTVFGQIGAFPGPCKITGIPLFDWLLDLTAREKRRLTDWQGHTPPKREDYPDYKDYYADYRKWRGGRCLRIPFGVFEVMLCFNDPGYTDYYSNLYPYIPFSSTEDRVGNLNVKKPEKSGGDVEVVDPIFEINVPAHSGNWVEALENNTPLHFAHMQENLELSSTLQSTFVPQSGTDQNLGYTEPPEIGPGCKILDVRSNPGDKLDPYPEDYKELSWGRFSYTAKFTCTFYYYTDPVSGRIIVSPPTCTKIAVFTSKINVGTPLADEIWAQTVAGNSAIFKMIFPKLNVAGSPGSIKDIPGVTPIVYDSRPYISAAAAVTPTSPEIYFPHLGGVSEYFLKGIQTMLRPKGYGEAISFGETSPTGPTGSTDICSDLANCNQNPDLVDLTGVKQKFIDLANRWLGVGHPRTDMYETVVSSAQAAGVDPIFALAIWLNESGASNYDGACQVLGHGDPSSVNCQRAQDFGINKPDKETQYNPDGSIIIDHFMDQLQIFLGLPNYYYSTCKGGTSAKCPMEIFGAMFKWGECNPTSNSNAYIAGILNIYGWLKPSQIKPCYPVALP